MRVILPRMEKIRIPTGTNSVIRIVPKPENPPETIERLGVSARVAGEMLGVSEATMRSLAKQRKVRAVKFGKRKLLFSVQSLRDFIDGKQNPSMATALPADDSGKEKAWVAEGKERE